MFKTRTHEALLMSRGGGSKPFSNEVTSKRGDPFNGNRQ